MYVCIYSDSQSTINTLISPRILKNSNENFGSFKSNSYMDSIAAGQTRNMLELTLSDLLLDIYVPISIVKLTKPCSFYRGIQLRWHCEITWNITRLWCTYKKRTDFLLFLRRTAIRCTISMYIDQWSPERLGNILGMPSNNFCRLSGRVLEEDCCNTDMHT